MIITFDGPAGSGKSTIAKLVAQNLGFIHFNSGSIFRAITAFMLENNKDIEKLKNAIIKVEIKDDVQFVYINNIDYTPILRNNEISKNVAQIAALPEVQLAAQKIIKEFCNSHNVVIDGRGLGNEVLKQSEFKFYLDCSIEVRAQRRFLERQRTDLSITLEGIQEQLKIRDKLDRERDIAPLKIPEKAIIIDSSNLTINDVVEKILKYIKN